MIQIYIFHANCKVNHCLSHKLFFKLLKIQFFYFLIKLEFINFFEFNFQILYQVFYIYKSILFKGKFPFCFVVKHYITVLNFKELLFTDF